MAAVANTIGIANSGAANSGLSPSFSEEDFPPLSREALSQYPMRKSAEVSREKTEFLSRSFNNEFPVMDWKSGRSRSAQRSDSDEEAKIEHLAEQFLHSPQGRKFGNLGVGGGKADKY